MEVSRVVNGRTDQILVVIWVFLDDDDDDDDDDE